MVLGGKNFEWGVRNSLSLHKSTMSSIQNSLPKVNFISDSSDDEDADAIAAKYNGSVLDSSDEEYDENVQKAIKESSPKTSPNSSPKPEGWIQHVQQGCTRAVGTRTYEPVQTGHVSKKMQLPIMEVYIPPEYQKDILAQTILRERARIRAKEQMKKELERQN